ncbi:MAG: hypothetical protein ACOZNI_25280 [Myxococcota bacterium]
MILLLACSPAWTPETALAPFLARLDADGDGRATQAEVVPARMPAAAFDAMDADDDGAISVGELETSLRINDPDRWAEGVLDPSAEMAAMLRQEHVGDRSDGWMLQVLREEALARDPAAAVPSPEEMFAAAMAGRGSPEWEAAIAKLAAAWPEMPASVR